MRTQLIFSFLLASGLATNAATMIIPIETESTALVYSVGENGRLYQAYLGNKLDTTEEYALLPQGNEAYMTHGM